MRNPKCVVDPCELPAAPAGGGELGGGDVVQEEEVVLVFEVDVVVEEAVECFA